ncbi:MAG: sigma-70 family RNA polymerase sigma factor [Phycisphaerae bacterium]|nr:sigma-70 family RNA polymerase sigma factor [Phycisphaerae bacterium]
MTDERPEDRTRGSGIAGDDAADLMAHARGDSHAFGRLYDRHAAVILALCRTLIPGHSLADAEDAAQETFLRAHRMLDRLVDPRGFRPWLYQIARLVASERRRSTARRLKHEDHAMTLAQDAQRANLPAHGADVASRRESLDRLTVALRSLPDPERLAIHLYYLDPDPVRAAESTLGLSRSGFYKILARAREHLAALLGEEATR